MDLEIRGSGAVKISEVISTLTGSPDFPHRAVRLALGVWKPRASELAGDSSLAPAVTILSPLDLDAVRNRASPEAVVLAV